MPLTTWLSDPLFDARSTPSTTGAITEKFRLRPGTVRSIHPTFSVSARGPGRSNSFPPTSRRAHRSDVELVRQADRARCLAGVVRMRNCCVYHVPRVRMPPRRVPASRGSPKGLSRSDTSTRRSAAARRNPRARPCYLRSPDRRKRRDCRELALAAARTTYHPQPSAWTWRDSRRTTAAHGRAGALAREGHHHL